MPYAKAAGAGAQNSSQNGSQSSERFYDKNMVVCFANGVDFEALAEALNRETYWSDVAGYQKVEFNRRFPVVFNNTQTRDRLVENGINVNGIHVNFAYHRKKEDPKIRVYISQLAIGIKFGQIYEVFKAYALSTILPRLKESFKVGRLTLMTGSLFLRGLPLTFHRMLMLEVGVLSSITEASRKPAELMAVLTIWPKSVQKLKVNKTRSNPKFGLKVNPKTSQVLLQVIVIPKVNHLRFHKRKLWTQRTLMILCKTT